MPVTKKEEKDHANDEEDEEKREPTESPHRTGPTHSYKTTTH